MEKVSRKQIREAVKYSILFPHVKPKSTKDLIDIVTEAVMRVLEERDPLKNRLDKYE